MLSFFNVILALLILLYRQPAYDSRSVDIAKLGSVIADVELSGTQHKVVTYALSAVSIFILLLGVIFTVLVFSWQ